MSRYTTDLYFEAHVTTEPVSGGRLAALREVAGKFGFRVANLVMMRDFDVPNDNDAFMTGRSDTYDGLEIRVLLLTNALRHAGFVVRRYKIENTLLDIRPPKPVMAPRPGDEESWT